MICESAEAKSQKIGKYFRAVLYIIDLLHCLFQMKAIYQDYFSYLMDEKVMATKMAREFWNELDDMLPLGASLQQDVQNWPWATKVVVCTVNHNSYPQHSYTVVNFI